MTEEIYCLEQLAREVAAPVEKLHRQARALGKWSRALGKRTTKTIGARQTNMREWFSFEDGLRLLGKSRACRQVLEGKSHEMRKVKDELELVREREKIKKNDSLGILAGGIAHDLNNLLQGLVGNLSLAKMCLAEESEAFQFVVNAEKVYARANQLNTQLLAFSSGGNSLPAILRLSEHLRAAVTSGLRTHAHEVTFELAGDLWPVHIDLLQFRQVLANLVTNAVEAMPVVGKIRVTAENKQLSGGKFPRSLPPGQYVTISIQDQGCGIRQEDLPHIFDPYFSTKQRGVQKGMGLGLALCQKIIHNNGGAITVKTGIGQGSTFHIYLPAATITAEKMAINTEVAGHGPRILIMDDEAAVVEVATRYLRLCGYRVDSTTHSDGAITAFHQARAANAPHALVILDLTMSGGMGGKEVCAILRATDPEVKVIISSGYAEDPAITDFRDHGFAEVLVKPYPLERIKTVVARLV